MKYYEGWCLCSRRILTVEQIEKHLPCDLCQKEHAEGFKDRVKKLQKEEE